MSKYYLQIEISTRQEESQGVFKRVMVSPAFPGTGSTGPVVSFLEQVFSLIFALPRMDVSKNQTINIASLNTNRHSVEYCKPLWSIMNSLLGVANKTFSRVEQGFETDTAQIWSLLQIPGLSFTVCVAFNKRPLLPVLSSVNVGVRIAGPIQGSCCMKEMKSFLSRAQPEPVASALQEGWILVRAGLQKACPYAAMVAQRVQELTLNSMVSLGKQSGRGDG